MRLFEIIAASFVQLADTLSESAAACTFIAGVFSFGTALSLRCLVSGLFEMHRSRSALKKISKQYSFIQKVLMKHAWSDCLHAKRFCRGLIVYHHCVWGLFFVELLLALLSGFVPGLTLVIPWFAIVSLVGGLIPVWLLWTFLDRHPFRRRKHEFKFRKYHNTADYDSLW